MKDEKLYLIHVLECISRIQSYTVDGRDKFVKDNMVQDAVVPNWKYFATSQRGRAITTLIDKAECVYKSWFSTSTITKQNSSYEPVALSCCL